MLTLQNISKRFPSFSLENISFKVEHGDYFILLGESGAGKSMLLETIAGLVIPDSGNIWLNGKEITGEKIQNRNIGLVFQDHAVFPHLTVSENIIYALHNSGLSKERKKKKVNHIAKELDIAELLSRNPETLSGGELQRVALGRTLVQEPKILLLDEPLASLDTRLKGELRRLLRKIHRKGQTILHVTHDYEEALSLGTRIAVINAGKIIQDGTPAEVFHHPRSEFVAHFIGVKNYFPARLVMENEASFAVTDNNIRIRIVTDENGIEGFVLVRGEDILLSNEPVETSATNNFAGKITEVVASSGGLDVVVDIGIEIHALITRESCIKLGIREGNNCWVHFKATAVRFIRS
jgi:molybdopterin-binding protein